MKAVKLLLCIIVVVAVFTFINHPPATSSGYVDIVEHPAELIIKQAAKDGLIDDVNRHLFPDEPLTLGQALSIAGRAVGAQELSVLSGVEGISHTDNISRLYAYNILAEAFSLIEAHPVMMTGYNENFSDFGTLSYENQQAIASIFSFLPEKDTYTVSYLDESITRAEFLTVLYNLIGEYISQSDIHAQYNYGVMMQNSAHLYGLTLDDGIWFDRTASRITLNNVTVPRAVILSEQLDALIIDDNTQIGTLTLASQSGDIALANGSGVAIDVLNISNGGGIVSVDSAFETIEITGDERIVSVSADINTIIVSGHNSALHIQDSASVQKVLFTESATGSKVTVDGYAELVQKLSAGGVADGSGTVDTLQLAHSDTEIGVNYINLIDFGDLGLLTAQLSIETVQTLPAGETLRVDAMLKDAIHGKEGTLTWYIDSEVHWQGTITTGRPLDGLTHNFTYSRLNMPGSADIKAELVYVDDYGQVQTLTAERTVELENYPKQYWMDKAQAAVLRKVTSEYKGNRTLEYAEANDYDDFEKEVWINANGYESETDYLLWVNITYQRTNFFRRGDDGLWELYKECIIGSGRNGTPRGVTDVHLKESRGWTTANYTVKPVVYFYGVSGYAFHSRTYYPGTTRIKDPSIGFPISAGCIRMYDEDIAYIFDEIPLKTTVVIH